MKAMDSIQDLIEEAKLRTVWWSLCIFSLTYFLSHTSPSMWMNLPISILLLSFLRILFRHLEFTWKDDIRPRRPSGRDSLEPPGQQSYLAHLEKRQLSTNDSRLSSAPPPPKWKRKIDSPVVEAAVGEFIDKILKDFVVDLWYSDITPDKEGPELMRAIIMEAIGEVSARVKAINLVDLLTRDVVDLIGDHLDLFRRNQAAIGVEVMETLSTEERDERLKHHLMASKELHTALISPESEYKVLQRLISGVLAVVLRPREAQCPIVRTIARELVASLVLQPVMNLASPVYINEIIEYVLVAITEDSSMDLFSSQPIGGSHTTDSTSKMSSSLSGQSNDVFDDKKSYQETDMSLVKVENSKETSLDCYSMQPRHADWAWALEAATHRRDEVLTPENLENMWTKGRNYKRKERKYAKAGVQECGARGHKTDNAESTVNLGKDLSTNSREEKAIVKVAPGLSHGTQPNAENTDGRWSIHNHDEKVSFQGLGHDDILEKASNAFVNANKAGLRRSNSASNLKYLSENKKVLTDDVGAPIISEFYHPDFGFRSGELAGQSGDHAVKKVSDGVFRGEGSHIPKLRCRVLGAYFEKLGSKSFAVYSIAVTDAENRTWFVKRRYRNFERLHRHLKDIPNYTLHLPPKRIFSSSTEDAFVHQRCIQLDKYLQDLLSIANVAEQHEVWDFLSVSSKNYSFGKSSSVMRTLAVNVDDAVDDIVRQFKGVSDGLIRKVSGTSSSPIGETNWSIHNRTMSWHADQMNKHVTRQDTLETVNSGSDNEHGQEEVSPSTQANGWHSDNELNSKGFPPRVIKREEVMSEWVKQGRLSAAISDVSSSQIEDPVEIRIPPEWTPPNVSVPLLNLVDKVFQLQRRGWLRRQVFWISKQILQLIMEDAIDDWLLRQIYWLRREDTVAQGIRWVQDVLWPDGTFFTRVGVKTSKDDGDDQLNLAPFQISQFGGGKASKNVSFEEQLEAARRASYIKKMLFDGAPTALVSLIGNKQYKRCARDIFYFTQSTICVKQLAYAILELVLISLFPELRDLLLELNEKMRASPA